MSVTPPWFPRPACPGAISLLGPSGELEAIEIFDLLWSRAALEWRDKVGVSSPADGSAKATTRLLCSEGWVFKTDTCHAELAREGPLARLGELVATANRVELWHPDKRWFVLRSIGGPLDPERPHWWPVSVCPRLRSLRTLDDWRELYTRWAAVIAFAIERSTHDGVGLDLGPANFGLTADRDGGPAECWYLDDELYPPLELLDLAGAIVNRIPEWPEVSAAGFAEYGAYLRGLLEPLQLEPGRFAALREQLGDVPLVSRWEPARAALLDGLGAPRSTQPASFGADGATRRTAVLGDVHANHAALEAVLEDCEARGVDSYLLLGDLVGYGPDPVACVERLRQLPRLLAIRGNHDHMACYGISRAVNELARASHVHTRAALGPEQLAFLSELPLELRGSDWIAVHGAPIDSHRFHAYVYDLSYRANLDYLLTIPQRLCFHGHTHVPRIYHQDGPEAPVEVRTPTSGTFLDLARPGAKLVTPGSVGQPRDGDSRAAYAIWDHRARRLEFQRVVYDVGRTRARLRSVRLPEALGARLELGQ